MSCRRGAGAEELIIHRSGWKLLISAKIALKNIVDLFLISPRRAQSVCQLRKCGQQFLTLFNAAHGTLKLLADLLGELCELLFRVLQHADFFVHPDRHLIIADGM